MAIKTRPALRMSGPAAPAAQPPAESPPPAGKAAARMGKVQLGYYLEPEAKRQIDVFAAMNGRTLQNIGEEMVDDWFRKHGLHRLASKDSAE